MKTRVPEALWVALLLGGCAASGDPLPPLMSRELFTATASMNGQDFAARAALMEAQDGSLAFGLLAYGTEESGVQYADRVLQISMYVSVSADAVPDAARLIFREDFVPASVGTRSGSLVTDAPAAFELEVHDDGAFHGTISGEMIDADTSAVTAFQVAFEGVLEGVDCDVNAGGAGELMLTDVVQLECTSDEFAATLSHPPAGG
jgi:hypothetical protein